MNANNSKNVWRGKIPIDIDGEEYLFRFNFDFSEDGFRNSEYFFSDNEALIDRIIRKNVKDRLCCHFNYRYKADRYFLIWITKRVVEQIEFKLNKTITCLIAINS